MKVELTESLIADLEAGPKDLVVWDTLVPGLHVKVTPAGRKTFSLFYREDGRIRRPKLADVGQITLAEARQKAQETLARLAEAKRKAARKKLGLE